jgi:pimeloyl-ACP methyl ester carboxylesterase
VTSEPAAPTPETAEPSTPPDSALRGAEGWADIDGPVHYLDFGGPGRGPVIVCVHGLAGSAVNWSAIAPLLTTTCRVFAVDLAGHGLTRSAGRSTDVRANRRLLHRFVERRTGTPVILMGNSMGGMISLLEASAEPDVVSGVILIDPALPFVPARPDLLVAAARTHPTWSVAVLPGVGHVPQLEAAHECADAILAWLDSSGRPAAQSATPPTPALSSICRRVRRTKRESE